MRKLWLLALLIAAACSSEKESRVALPEGFTDVQQYFTAEAKRLDRIQPGLQKTIQMGEDVNSTEADSVSWSAEFEPFLQVDPAMARYRNAFEKSQDSGNGISILRFFAKDTLCDIQEVTTTHKKGRLELLEIRTRERSWAVDRERWMSYQPGRGYRIVVTEDYIWSGKRSTEIFATFRNAEF